MKKNVSTVLYTFCIWFLFGGMNYANGNEAKIDKDSIVVVTGKVIDKESQEPLKAVVHFKRLPHGNEVGRISSNDNGEFTIYVHDNGSYNITVDSEGYFAHSEEFNVSYELSNNESITREIALEAGDVGYVFTLENLIFELGQAEITRSSYGELDMLVSRLQQYPNMEIQLEGHTDTRGNADANMQLSRDRVNSVKTYLVNKGIDAERIKTRAFGGTRPLSTEDTEEAHASNRRVEVRILKVE